MSLETATYVADLQSVNPPSTDPTSQGDDHLRLIKQVLQNTFPGASRAFQVPSVLTKTANYSILSGDGEGVIYVGTAGGAVTLTLPALGTVDKGWKINFIKTSSDVNPMFIAPAAGTLNSGGYAGLAKARRCIPGARSTAVWDGAAWFVTRVSTAPIGCMLDFYGTTLPAGFEWPNGQTLASVATNYPEYNAAVGSGLTPDMRGYAGIVLDNLGGAAAGRLPNGQISGSVLGATGGVDAAVITSSQLPAHQHNVFIYDPTHSHTLTAAVSNAGGSSPPGGASVSGTGTVSGTNAASTGMTIGSVAGAGANDNKTANSTGGGAIRGNLQPSIMLGKILVVE
jgi:hypothetical protein